MELNNFSPSSQRNCMMTMREKKKSALVCNTLQTEYFLIKVNKGKVYFEEFVTVHSNEMLLFILKILNDTFPPVLLLTIVGCSCSSCVHAVCSLCLISWILQTLIRNRLSGSAPSCYSIRFRVNVFTCWVNSTEVTPSQTVIYDLEEIINIKLSYLSSAVSCNWGDR